jgi:hypothetical protein
MLVYPLFGSYGIDLYGIIFFMNVLFIYEL